MHRLTFFRQMITSNNNLSFAFNNEHFKGSRKKLIVFWCPKGQTVPRDLLIDYVYCPMAAAYVYCLTFLAQTLYHLYTLISLMKCFILKCY